MLFTIKDSRSERRFQFSFGGFGFGGKNKIEDLLRACGAFFVILFKYFSIRFFQVITLCFKLFPLLIKTSKELKTYLISKLIWSRGRLGRPVATLIVMSIAFVVFLTGKVFNSSRLVNSQDISPDYLANVSDIIPERNTALTVLPENRQRNEPLSYAVQPGDTLSGIGNKFKISVDALRYVNNLWNVSYLKVGQTVIIPPVAGITHKVASGETLRSIALKYDVPEQIIADFNYILDPSKIAVGTELVVPDAKIPGPVIIPITPAINNTGNNPIIDTGASKGWCKWPTTARIITTYFTWKHNGLDIANSTGYVNLPALAACAGGTVVRAGWDPWGLGLHVRIDHGNGYETIYGHMSRIDVEFGERVSRGEQVGIMGSTGNSTGPHVHFMVKYKGIPQNPLNYIQ